LTLQRGIDSQRWTVLELGEYDCRCGGNPIIRTTCVFIAATALVGLAGTSAWAHPASGIVVDLRGQVFFTGIGSSAVQGIWKIDIEGRLTRVHKTGAHWLALDAGDRFARSDLDGWLKKRLTPWLDRYQPPGGKPALIQADGCPIVVHDDGNLYFAHRNLEITRLAPDGALTKIGPNLAETTEKLGGIKGLAAGPKGSLYVACPNSLLKVDREGNLTTVVHPVVVKDGKGALTSAAEPQLRGLSVDANGTIYAAATGARRVLRIMSNGKVKTLSTSESPWSPTGTAIHAGDVYVLEYAHAESDDQAKWQPRVRKLARDGKVTTLATVPLSNAKADTKE